MVEEQLIARGINDSRILDAFSKLPRERFVPPELISNAYSDKPLPIGSEQTISQPYIVALMLETLQLHGNGKILEIGTGSGYLTALLAELEGEVYSIEFNEKLFRETKNLLSELGYYNIFFRCGDGSLGWPEAAPFDAIIISAATPTIPRELVKQLKVGGRMILPFGDEAQELVLVKKTKDGIESQDLGPVKFVEMKGKVREE